MHNTYYVFNKNEAKCTRVIDRHTLRVYTQNFEYNKNINYYDIYLDEHYMVNYGSEWFWYNDQYNHATFPSCIDNNLVSDNVYYRNDIDSILIITFILALLCFYFPFKILSRLFGRWLKL